jgi:hypothetical protein
MAKPTPAARLRVATARCGDHDGRADLESPAGCRWRREGRAFRLCSVRSAILVQGPSAGGPQARVSAGVVTGVTTAACDEGSRGLSGPITTTCIMLSKSTSMMLPRQKEFRSCCWLKRSMPQ